MRSILPSEIEEGEERAAGFVLFRTLNRQRQYLLLHHQSGCHWAFPKGRLEPGEAEIEAAIRETFEETSISNLVPVVGFRETSSYTVSRNGQPRSKTVAYFLAETTESEVSLSTEHRAFQWLVFSEAVGLLTHDENRQILTDAECLLTTLVDDREQDDPQ